MKSNKQRREEIKARRLARTATFSSEYAARGLSVLKAGRSMPDMVLADKQLLARCNNSDVLLMPDYYQDQVFNCRDCGAQEVWTARQQKWWYEVIHAPIDSRAVRCPVCRRAHKAQKAASMAHEGADLLREQTYRLRDLGAKPPTDEALAEIEAALQSKWWSLRTVAIQTLGRWGGPRQIAQLEALVAAHSGRNYWGSDWESTAAREAATALRLREPTP